MKCTCVAWQTASLETAALHAKHVESIINDKTQKKKGATEAKLQMAQLAMYEHQTGNRGRGGRGKRRGGRGRGGYMKKLIQRTPKK